MPSARPALGTSPPTRRPHPTTQGSTSRGGITKRTPYMSAPNTTNTSKPTKHATLRLLESALPAPFSNLSDYPDITLPDMHSHVHRSTAARHAEARERGKIPRPLDCFRLYRMCYHEVASAFCRAFKRSRRGAAAWTRDTTFLHALVFVCGASWRREPEWVRTGFKIWALVEREKHRAAFPEGWFAPDSWPGLEGGEGRVERWAFEEPLGPLSPARASPGQMMLGEGEEGPGDFAVVEREEVPGETLRWQHHTSMDAPDTTGWTGPINTTGTVSGGPQGLALGAHSTSMDLAEIEGEFMSAPIDFVEPMPVGASVEFGDPMDGIILSEPMNLGEPMTLTEPLTFDEPMTLNEPMGLGELMPSMEPTTLTNPVPLTGLSPLTAAAWTPNQMAIPAVCDSYDDYFQLPEWPQQVSQFQQEDITTDLAALVSPPTMQFQDLHIEDNLFQQQPILCSRCACEVFAGNINQDIGAPISSLAAIADDAPVASPVAAVAAAVGDGSAPPPDSPRALPLVTL